MKTFLLLLFTSILASAQWAEVANLDRDLEKIIASNSHLVAYTTDKVAASTDGLTWSPPVDPGFPVLQMTRTPSGDLVALGYKLASSSPHPERPYSIVIMDSTDGINWTQRHEILYFEGLALPIAGEIAVTDTHHYLTFTTEHFGGSEAFSLYGNATQTSSSFLNHTNLVALDGDIFGEGPTFSNIPCTFTRTLSSSTLNPPSESWRDLLGYLDLRTTSDNLLIGQNGISRKDGEIYYGNWNDLGEIKGYHNGVGLIMTESEFSPKLYLSRNFLHTWTEQNLSEFNPIRYIDATFFKNQWFVLADSSPTNDLYSLPVAPITYQSHGLAQLKATPYRDRPFTIPGCKDNLTTSLGIALTFPDKADKLYQIYTSNDLLSWTAYGLPFPGATTHHHPIIPGLWNHQRVFFRAEEVSLSEPN